MISRIFSVFLVAMLAACAQPDSEAPAADAAATAEQAAGDARDAAEAVVAEINVAELVAAADPEEGKRFYIFCQACHSIDAGGRNKVGPNLNGIVGAPAAQVEGFIYSDALNSAGLTWDVETLDAWIKRPAELVPGTTMVFAGINDPAQRAALIAFMQQVDTE